MVDFEWITLVCIQTCLLPDQCQCQKNVKNRDYLGVMKCLSVRFDNKILSSLSSPPYLFIFLLSLNFISVWKGVWDLFVGHRLPPCTTANTVAFLPECRILEGKKNAAGWWKIKVRIISRLNILLWLVWLIHLYSNKLYPLCYILQLCDCIGCMSSCTAVSFCGMMRVRRYCWKKKMMLWSGA